MVVWRILLGGVRVIRAVALPGERLRRHFGDASCGHRQEPIPGGAGESRCRGASWEVVDTDFNQYRYLYQIRIVYTSGEWTIKSGVV